MQNYTKNSLLSKIGLLHCNFNTTAVIERWGWIGECSQVVNSLLHMWGHLFSVLAACKVVLYGTFFFLFFSSFFWLFISLIPFSSSFLSHTNQLSSAA